MPQFSEQFVGFIDCGFGTWARRETAARRIQRNPSQERSLVWHALQGGGNSFKGDNCAFVNIHVFLLSFG
jgi:hypothetical protein